MGCYGIGINRILASLIERSYDESGIIWPVNLAPCEVIVIPVNKDDKSVTAEAERIYNDLSAEGIDVLIDDREQKSVGVKFKDADLIGIPLRVTIGPRQLKEGKIEVKLRKEAEGITVPVEGAVDHILAHLDDYGQA